MKEVEDGKLTFDIISRTEVIYNDQHVSFTLLRIFRQFYKGEEPDVYDYGRVNSENWGILFTYSDIFWDIFIPEWNKIYPKCELKYDVKLLDYAYEHGE